MFVPGKTFQPSLMFVWVRPDACLRIEQPKGASLGQAPANIRLGWKGLPGTNARSSLLRKFVKKSLMGLAPGPRLFT